MDDRAVNILEKYDMKVLRTWKGRGSILLETEKGTRILKEYIGSREKLLLQDKLIQHMKQQGVTLIDEFERNREDEILNVDVDQKSYVVKTYYEGKECSVWDPQECKMAVERLAALQKTMQMNTEQECIFLPVVSLEKEYEKHNKELKRIRNAIRDKSQKTEFEIYLLHHYDYYYEQALQAYERTMQTDWTTFYEQIKGQGNLCHGDYQHHNIMMNRQGVAVINFEKYVLDSRVRDLYMFMRKVLEKNMWSRSLGTELLSAYEAISPLQKQEKIQLFDRFLYPEKFWKIVNAYYNSGKAWMPMRHMEKLEKLIQQEKTKEQFMQEIMC
ncbi:MAG: CotS family spore coat protein [Lachnospiraceae bacterium]